MPAVGYSESEEKTADREASVHAIELWLCVIKTKAFLPERGRATTGEDCAGDMAGAARRERHSTRRLSAHSLLQGQAATCWCCGERVAARNASRIEQRRGSDERIARPAATDSAGERTRRP